jgi:SNF2 family DNA or RNA helicase
LLLSPQGPLEWPAELFPFQKVGIQALYEREALLLADDMGLGKTIQVIGALRLLFQHRKIDSALVIARASLLSQWRKELRTWAPELRVSVVHGRADERVWLWNARAHVFLTSYETLRSDFTQNPASPPRRREWCVVVLDEAQAIKNRDTEVTRKCKQLLRQRAWAVTGTPLENTIEELVSVLEFVRPLGEGESAPELSPGPALLQRHHAVQVRRKKTEVLPDLPPKVVSSLSLPLGAAQRESYDRAEREGIIHLRERGETIRIEHVLELITRLKQICNFCPTSRQSAKLEDMRDRLDTLTSEGHRAIVFSQFTDGVYGCEALASALASYRPLVYTGALSTAERDAVVREFKENPDRQVLILSLRAGGQGLNLQEASYVFHFDRWWNPAVEHQAEDRSHRMGQRVPVNVYKYTCEATVEERIDAILRDKQLLFDEMVDDVSLDLAARLTQEDLFGLFDLKPPPSGASTPRTREPSPNYGAMSGEDFERYVKGLLEQKGWRTETTPRTRDAGIDLIARRTDEVGAEVTLYIQCKNLSQVCGVEVVRELNGAMPRHHPGARGVVVCPSGFSGDAVSWARERGILLWDRERLFELSH